jgi:hypothetical protein
MIYINTSMKAPLANPLKKPLKMPQYKNTISSMLYKMIINMIDTSEVLDSEYLASSFLVEKGHTLV